MQDGFDFADTFDEDYLYFYEPMLTEERSDADAELIWRLGPMAEGNLVLDLACGHGRIANRLATRGAAVTGYDLTPAFFDHARADAARRGVEVDYVRGDMRALDYSKQFDVVVNWFTAFGYFDDDTDRQVLHSIWRSLRPGGRFLLDVQHGPSLLARLLPSIVYRRGEDMMVDENQYDALTGRIHSRRTIVRDGRCRSFHFSTRLFAYSELRDWLLAAGFREVEAFGPEGEPLSLQSRRMVIRATR